jgi:hypothetical protein
MNRHQRRQAKALRLSDDEAAARAAIAVIAARPRSRKTGWLKLRARRSQTLRIETPTEPLIKANSRADSAKHGI